MLPGSLMIDLWESRQNGVLEMEVVVKRMRRKGQVVVLSLKTLASGSDPGLDG